MDERKTPDEWLKTEYFAGIQVLDPDGWDRKNFTEDWVRPLTLQEMNDKVVRSTLQSPAGWPPTTVKQCVRITVDGGDGWAFIVAVGSDFPWETLFDGADPGDAYRVELVEMTQVEYDALPEFDGF